MRTEVQEPTTNEYGYEVHPAYGMVNVNRVSSSSGTPMFDSEIKHTHFITITFSQASRKRDLHKDWIHGGSKRLFQVRVSEAQWAQMVSSLNTSGTAVTIEYNGAERVPEIPYAPRMALQIEETRKAAGRMFTEVQEALEAYKEHKTVGNLRTLEITLQNAAPNVTYAAKALTEHTEDVVSKARADVEAMVDSRARQLGIDPVMLTMDTGDIGQGVEEIEA